VSPIRYSWAVKYGIETTPVFDQWLDEIKDKKTRYRVDARVDRIVEGNFGDHKQVAHDVFELRFFFGGGLRIYYTVRNNKVVLLLSGGDKSSQRKDIKHAELILTQLERH